MITELKVGRNVQQEKRVGACITVECAYNMFRTEHILPDNLMTLRAFEEYVNSALRLHVEDRFGTPSIDIDSYFRLHRRFEPNKENNGGRRSLEASAWLGPKVLQGEYRGDARPRVPRRANERITTGWEIVPLYKYANGSLPISTNPRFTRHAVLANYRRPEQELRLSGRKVSFDGEQYQDLLGTDPRYKSQNNISRYLEPQHQKPVSRVFSFDKLLKGRAQYRTVF